MNRLYTIGYQGRGLSDVIHELKVNGVQYLVDVRATPVSHKREFSKEHLREAVEQNGISYMHIGALGSPQELRNRLRLTGDLNSFFRSYEAYLRSHPELLRRVAEVMEKGTICLICLEQRPQECHRQVIASLLRRADASVRVKHL
ncbi:MAG: DUF488 domain-containing protein [Thermodesulfobacteriota bacterium]